MTVYIVYGQDWTYGRDGGVRGVFLNQCHALQFAATLQAKEPIYQFVAEKWEAR